MKKQTNIYSIPCRFFVPTYAEKLPSNKGARVRNSTPNKSSPKIPHMYSHSFTSDIKGALRKKKTKKKKRSCPNHRVISKGINYGIHRAPLPSRDPQDSNPWFCSGWSSKMVDCCHGWYSDFVFCFFSSGGVFVPGKAATPTPNPSPEPSTILPFTLALPSDVNHQNRSPA